MVFSIRLGTISQISKLVAHEQQLPLFLSPARLKRCCIYWFHSQLFCGYMSHLFCQWTTSISQYAGCRMQPLYFVFRIAPLRYMSFFFGWLISLLSQCAWCKVVSFNYIASRIRQHFFLRRRPGVRGSSPLGPMSLWRTRGGQWAARLASCGGRIQRVSGKPFPIDG